MAYTIRVASVDSEGNIEVVRVNDVTIKFTFKDGDGNAIDITGWTIRLAVKENSDDDSTIFLIDQTSLTDPTNGIAEVPLTKTQLTLDSKTYRYDAKYITNANKERTFLPNRKFIVSENIGT